MSTLAIGTEVRIRHEGVTRRAQVTGANPDGSPQLAIYVAGMIVGGSTEAALATEPAHQITDGYYWQEA